MALSSHLSAIPQRLSKGSSAPCHSSKHQPIVTFFADIKLSFLVFLSATTCLIYTCILGSSGHSSISIIGAYSVCVSSSSIQVVCLKFMREQSEYVFLPIFT